MFEFPETTAKAHPVSQTIKHTYTDRHNGSRVFQIVQTAASSVRDKETDTRV
jgi:hypothetical protein